MADTQAELEELRKQREETKKKIEDKKRQVQELKAKRAQRVAQQELAKNNAAAGGGQKDSSKTVDGLVAELLGANAFEAAAAQKEAKSEKPKNGEGGSKRHGRSFQEEYKLGVVNLQPQEQEVYERSCQTDMSGEIKGKTGGGVGGGDIMLAAATGVRKPGNVLQQAQKMAEKARLRSVKPDAGQDSAHTGARARTVQTQDDKEDSQAQAAKELTPEELNRITNHVDFKQFFSKATLLVERTLGAQEWDVATDWKTAGKAQNAEASEGNRLMKHMEDFTEEKWAKGRPVTDVRFSPHKKEMFLSAYGQRVNAAPSDSDGCMLIWNLAMKSRPELCFSSPSQVLTAHFHRFDPAVFYGGTYSGGIVLWDARARTGPVLRTPLSGKGHSHPVTALQQVGTQNATNLVTASNDGRICVWSLNMLNLPQETIDLKSETKNRRDLAVMSLSFPENETNVLYVGAEDGSVCQVHLHGSKVGVTEMYDGHDGPVAGIDMHPHQVDASGGGDAVNMDMAVTCSFDWSIKVWMVKQYQLPVLSLDAFEDYVYDVKWHPTHPGVFASVDGEGHVDLWNLNQNIESPVVRCESPDKRRLALNHCHWSACGRRLAAGDSEGTVSVYGVDQSVSQPRSADYGLFNERARSFQPIAQRARDAGYGGYGDMSRFGPMSRGLDRH
mmetsp:Transcript_4964/g.12044  ORF Transcript_4964/g.12044 Transcript_4964/m.12044 type:complete len:669 (-) Transcript_4964:57-2063(-)